MSVILTRASQQAAGYRPEGGVERCGYCRFFVSQGTCNRILGPVSPRGWCRYFSRMVYLRLDGGADNDFVAGPPGVTLDMSFMSSGNMPPGVTFTRASTATYFNATGVMQTAATNVPRWDYNPQTLALNGLLIEEARTNLALQSANFTIGWNPTNATVTTGIAGAPDGTPTVSQVAETAANAIRYVGQTPTLSASTSYALSVYAKASGTRYLQLSLDDQSSNGGFATFDLQAGTISQALAARGTGVIGTAAIQPLANGFYRCSIVTTIGAATTGRGLYILSNSGTPGFAPSYLGNTANSLLLWGAQLERGAFPTSYVPTTTVAVTRAQDSCTIPPANMSWFTSPGGSWAVEFVTFNPVPGGASTRIVATPTPGGIGPVFLMAGPVNALGQYDGAVVNTANAASINVIAKGATAWASGSATACLNGGTVASSSGLTTGYASLVSSGVRFGANANAADGMTGYFRRVRYWPRALSNTEMQQVTT